MADNTILPVGGGGDTIRDIDRSLAQVNPVTGKTQVVQLDAGGQGREALVTSSLPLPVTGAAIEELLRLILLQLKANGTVLASMADKYPDTSELGDDQI